MEAALGSHYGTAAAAASSNNNNKENCSIDGGGGGGGGGSLRRPFRGQGEIDGDDDIASDKNQCDAGAVNYDGDPPRHGHFDAATAFTVSDEYRELLERMLKQYPLECFRRYSYHKRKRTVVDDDLGATDGGGGTSNETPADSSASSTATAKTAAEAASAKKNMRDDLEADDDTASSKNQGGVVYDGDPRQQGAASATSNDRNNDEFQFVRCGHCGSRRRARPSLAAYPLEVEPHDEEGYGGEAGRPDDDDDSSTTSKPKSKRMREDASEEAGPMNGAEPGNDVPAFTEKEEKKEDDTKAKLIALKAEFDAYVAEKDLADAKRAKEVKDLSDRIAVLESDRNDSKMYSNK